MEQRRRRCHAIDDRIFSPRLSKASSRHSCSKSVSSTQFSPSTSTSAPPHRAVPGFALQYDIRAVPGLALPHPPRKRKSPRRQLSPRSVQAPLLVARVAHVRARAPYRLLLPRQLVLSLLEKLFQHVILLLRPPPLRKSTSSISVTLASNDSGFATLVLPIVCLVESTFCRAS